MPILKYKISKWSNPEAIYIERETDSFVWIKGRRNSKSTEYEKYFDTIDECKQWMIGCVDRDILSAEDRLYRLRKEKEKLLKNIESWA